MFKLSFLRALPFDPTLYIMLSCNEFQIFIIVSVIEPLICFSHEALQTVTGLQDFTICNISQNHADDAVLDSKIFVSQ
jgi:hypothetical protein